MRLVVNDHGISGIVISWLYFSLQESGKRKSTLGKRVMNMYVCGYDGKRISFLRATVRYFSKYISMAIVFIGYVMVLWDDKAVTLTVTEFLILEALAQRPGVVKSRNQLLDVAYQDDVYVDDRTIDSHIKRIRRKFRGADPEFDAIETLYGVGYRFGEE